jgi:hypothetical protein
MRTVLKIARLALVGSALLLMASGMVLWNGTADQLGPLHALLGLVLVLSLWTIAGIAARAGVSLAVVALAVGGSLVAIALGVAQGQLLTGSEHWVIQVLHLVTAMGMVAWGQGLVLLMRRIVVPSDRPKSGVSAGVGPRREAHPRRATM